ncbi:MAG: response regulator [Magnetococcales bacterium]|nr:CHASE domain-containing protein [Magnetococcales bacterium]NGZ27815.1 response regulator [Magnetococcales bacterium]
MKHSRPWLFQPFTAWIILVTSLFLTVLAWWLTDHYVIHRGRDRFHFQTEEIASAIQRRMVEYQALLYGCLGVFQASDHVSRQEFATYIQNLRLSQYFPGIQGIGYSKVVPPQEKASHIREVRSEGFPAYRLWPMGEREIYTSIIYLEPFTGRNLRAIGYDMFSEPIRREAMERARDTGQLATSGMVTLVQETQVDVQPGFLIYLPNYKKNLPLETVDQRRAALDGFIYSPFRMGDLMKGILRNGISQGIMFEIFDGPQPFRHNLMYDSLPDGILHTLLETRSQFERNISLTFGGKTWTLILLSRPGFLNNGETMQPMVILAGGLLVDMLLFLLVFSLAGREQRAQNLANTMEEEAAQSRCHLQSMLDTFPFPAWIKNKEGRLLAANPVLAHAIGLASPSMIIGKGDLEIWPLEEALLMQTAHQRASQENGQHSFEMTLLHHGTTAPFRVTVTPLLDDHGKLMGTSGFALDHSEVKRLQEALQQASKIAQSTSLANSSFLAAISHQISTPMNSILGMGEVLANSPKLSDKEKTYLEVARRAGETLLAMMQTILDLAKLEAGQLQLDSQAFDLTAESRNAVHVLQEEAKRKGLVLNCRLMPGLPTRIVGDPQRLRHILLHLLNNAIKYTKQGSVTLTVKPEENQKLLFTVADSGCGISPERQVALFQPFGQGTSRFSSSGMGLYVCRQLVNLMGGKMWLESIVDHGTIFRFSVLWPWLAEDPNQIASPIITTSAPKTTKPIAILLVDDREDNRMVVRAFLENTPHRIEQADNGREAVELFLKISFDLILMDLMMPEMDGLEATRLIRSIEKHKNLPPTPIVALTATAVRQDLDNALAAGCNHYLRKPVRRSDLLEAIHSLQNLKEPSPDHHPSVTN